MIQLGMLLVASVLVFNAPVAAAQPPMTEVAEYQEDFNVPISTAAERLETQEAGSGLPSTLEGALGDSFAGVWFDNETGEFVVPKVPSAPADAISEVEQGYDLASDLRVATAAFTWEELEAAQRQVSAALTETGKGIAVTSIDAQSNAVVVRVGSAATDSERELIKRVAATANVRVKVVDVSAARQTPKVLACDLLNANRCDAPLRGGVFISPVTYLINEPPKYQIEPGFCTAGFKAIGNAYGNRFVLTAGHCGYLAKNADWATTNSNSQPHIIGPMEEWNFGTAGDYAKINANGSNWDKPVWPSMVAHFWDNQEYPIQYEAPTYKGQYVCASGNQSGTSCGAVVELHLLLGEASNAPGVTLPPLNETLGICSVGGDSGGPIFSYGQNTALGLMSAAREGENPCTDTQAYFQEIIPAAEKLGVTVGARIGTKPEVKTGGVTNTGNSGSAGQYASVTLNGEVQPNGLPTSTGFHYWESGKSPESGWSIAAGTVNGSAYTPVSLPLSNLKSGVSYNYELYATNAAMGESGITNVLGGVKSFTAPTQPPVATTGLVADKTSFTATVKGTVDARSIATNFRFEYGLTTAYGSSAPVPDKAVNYLLEPTPQVAVLTGLQSSTLYHYRIVATNSLGQTGYGADQTVITPTLAPLVTTKAATASGETAAMLRGTVNPQGAQTQYAFEFGPTTAYGSSVPVMPPGASAGSSKDTSEVSQMASGLTKGQSYHYRLIATNAHGTRYGGDQLVTAGWASKPVSPPSGSLASGLDSVSCVDANYCMAVGTYQSGTDGLTYPVAERWDGTSWTQVGMPAPAGVANTEVTGVSCVSSTFCSASGYFVTNAAGIEGYLARWDGTKWSLDQGAAPVGYPKWLFGISCASPTFCMASGGHSGIANGGVGLVQRWDGSKWSPVLLPTVSGAKSIFTEEATCLSSLNCIVVGQWYDNADKAQPVAFHWNGSSWTIRPQPSPAGYGVHRLLGVSCGAPSSCLAVGSGVNGGIAGGVAQRWDGSSWAALSQPHPPGLQNAWLMAVSCESPSSCLATGTYTGASNEEVPLAGRWTGSEWEAQSPPYVAGSLFTNYKGVSCKGGSCMAVGVKRSSTYGANEMVAAQYRMPIPVPTAVTEAASNVAASVATLNGAINPNGLATTYKFEYGPTTSYGTSVPIPAGSVGSGKEAVKKAAAISGLTGNTTYNYRVVATNAEGTTYGSNAVFKTLPSQYVGAFGSYGSGFGQLKQPADIAVDQQGYLWVADKGNNRLQKYNDQGVIQYPLGNAGSGGGQFSSPSGIASFSNGAIYIADTGNHRVQQFNENGEFVLTFGKDVNKTKVESGGTEAQRNLCTASSGNVCKAGVAGSLNGQYSSPTGLALTSGGNVMVVDKANNRVQKVSPTGEYLAKISSTPGGALKEPSSVAVASDGSIFVADTGNNRIVKWSSTFVFQSQFGSAGSGNGQFNGPVSIEMGPEGAAWVGDQGGDRVEIFSSTGTYVKQFGASGSGLGQFDFASPSGLAFAANGIALVTDQGNARVQKWKVE